MSRDFAAKHRAYYQAEALVHQGLMGMLAQWSREDGP